MKIGQRLSKVISEQRKAKNMFLTDKQVRARLDAICFDIAEEEGLSVLNTAKLRALSRMWFGSLQ